MCGYTRRERGFAQHTPTYFPLLSLHASSSSLSQQIREAGGESISLRFSLDLRRRPCVCVDVSAHSLRLAISRRLAARVHTHALTQAQADRLSTSGEGCAQQRRIREITGRSRKAISSTFLDRKNGREQRERGRVNKRRILRKKKKMEDIGSRRSKERGKRGQERRGLRVKKKAKSYS